jgi:hypothetical protein
MTLKDWLTIVAAAVIATVTFFTGRCTGNEENIPTVPAGNELSQPTDSPKEQDNQWTEPARTPEEKEDSTE